MGAFQAVCEAVGIAETFVEGETNEFADEEAAEDDDAEVDMTDRDPRCGGTKEKFLLEP